MSNTRPLALAAATVGISAALILAPASAAMATDYTTGGVTWDVSADGNAIALGSYRATSTDFLGSGLDVDGWSRTSALALVTNVITFPSFTPYEFGTATVRTSGSRTIVTRVGDGNPITITLELDGPFARWTATWDEPIPDTFLTGAIRSGETTDLRYLTDESDPTAQGTFIVTDSIGSLAPIAVQGTPNDWTVFTSTPGARLLMMSEHAVGASIPAGSVSLTARVPVGSPCSAEADAEWLASVAHGLADAFGDEPSAQPFEPCGSLQSIVQPGAPVDVTLPVQLDKTITDAGFLDAPSALRLVRGDLPSGYRATLDTSSGEPVVHLEGPALAPGETIDSTIGFYLETIEDGRPFRYRPVTVTVSLKAPALLASTGTTDATPGLLGALAAITTGLGIVVARRRARA